MPMYNSIRRISTSLTRPQDDSVYAAGDVVTDSSTAGTILTITNPVTDQSGSAVIMNAFLVDSSAQALAGDFEVWLFNTSPTAINDNAAFAPTDAEMKTVEAVITFNSTAGTIYAGSGNRIYRTGTIEYPISTAATDDDLYAIMVTRNAYVGVSGEQFTLVLNVKRDIR